MTKSEIAEKVKTQMGLTKKDSTEMVEIVFSTIKDALESGESLKLSGFGNFSVNSKKERKGRNPHTGEEITIAALKVLSFKPSTVLKTKINS